MQLSRKTLKQELEDAETEFELVRMVRMMKGELWMTSEEVESELMIPKTTLRLLCKKWKIRSTSFPQQRRKYREASLVLRTRGLGYKGSLGPTAMGHWFGEQLKCSKCEVGWQTHQKAPTECRIKERGVSKESKRNLLEMVAGGYTVAEAASLVGINEGYAFVVVNRANGPKTRQEKTAERRARAHTLYSEGLSHEEISKRLRRTVVWVKDSIIAHGETLSETSSPMVETAD